MSPRILFIDNESPLSRLIQLELQFEGYQVTTTHDGISGLIEARNSAPHLIILNRSLPGLNGLEICHCLRATGSTTPIILIGETSDICDRIAGLDAGADDYVMIPFSLEELLARVRSHLRRTYRQPENHVIQFEDLTLNRQTREVHRGDRLIALTAKEFDLLEYLMVHSRQVVTRENILETVWKYDYLGNSNIIEVYIGYLRRKIEGNQSGRLIHTVRGVGYVLREDTLKRVPSML